MDEIPLAAEPDDAARVAAARETCQRLVTEIEKVIVGQSAVVEQLLVALLARGHCLLIGVPGLAKTLLVKTLAQCLSWTFKRVQFTPDLMPTDILGTEVLHVDAASGERQFRFVPGPIFTHILLADEINRTPPKTQAALLEAMQECAVTAGGRTHLLEAPFFVVATQNPIEQEGTYPLPEAQLDRFLLSIRIDYPPAEDERAIVRRTTSDAAPTVAPVMQRADLFALQDLVRRMPVSEPVLDGAVRMARATRPGEEAPEFVRRYVQWGAGPRASQALVLGAKALALVRGKFAPSEQDVRDIAPAVLEHRIVLNYLALGEGFTPAHVVEALLTLEEAAAPAGSIHTLLSSLLPARPKP